VFIGEKLRVEDFKARGHYVEVPYWDHPELKLTKEKWGIFDRARSELLTIRTI